MDQIINLKHELVLLAGRIDWGWIDGEIAPLYSENGRPGIETRFMIGLLLLKHIYGLSDEGVCERWVHDSYFQFFTGEEFFQHAFPHERSDLSHRRKRLGDKLELLLAEYPRRFFISGQKRGVFGVIKRDLRRRSAIEPIIGHLKAEGHLGRCYLKGRAGDAANVIIQPSATTSAASTPGSENSCACFWPSVRQSGPAQSGFLTDDNINRQRLR